MKNPKPPSKYDICPTCGGQKTKVSKECQACCLVRVPLWRGGHTASIERYLAKHPCPDCGGPKGSTRSKRCRACNAKKLIGSGHHRWKGQHVTTGGYRMLVLPEHPNATKQGRVLEHVVVMSKMLGRALIPGENVHHKNGDKLDNRPENLELWSSSQPPGQRIKDKVRWAKEIIAIYEGVWLP